jgi:hypothetical protein
MKNKKSQAQSIIIFFVLIVAVLAVSIIILRITNSVITPFAEQLNATGTKEAIQASGAVSFAQSKFTAVWDWVIILLILFNVVILLVSAFLVDIHPAFLIIYIFAGLFLFIFGNSALGALDAIWGGVGTSTETAQTPLQQFLINNFQMFMLGIYVLSGVVMYSKIKWFSGQGTGGNY